MTKRTITTMVEVDVLRFSGNPYDVWNWVDELGKKPAPLVYRSGTLEVVTSSYGDVDFVEPGDMVLHRNGNFWGMTAQEFSDVCEDQ